MAGCFTRFGITPAGNSTTESVSRKMYVRSLVVGGHGSMHIVNKITMRNLCGTGGSNSVSLVKNGMFEFSSSILRPKVRFTCGAGFTSVSEGGNDGDLGSDTRISENEYSEKVDCGGDDDGGGKGRYSGGEGGGGGGGDSGNGGSSDEGDDIEEEEFGPILKYEEVIKEAEARNVTLPSDMVEAARTVGIRKLLLERYLNMQGSIWPLGYAIRTFSMLRNRMLADPSFLFKIGTEIVIDSCCATFAEVQKRGKDFWQEFELYVADLIVGLVLNVALVGMLAPCARIGRPQVSKGIVGGLLKAYNGLPGSVFEAERPGCRFSVKQRVATYFFKGILYGSAGFACGIIGQGIANLIMTAKRSIKKSEDDIPVPPLIKSAALWAVFLGVSSNTRYQIVNGLERLVESSTFGKQAPPVAMAFTVGVRFANNVYGGMQFVDWARWSGVQ